MDKTQASGPSEASASASSKPSKNPLMIEFHNQLVGMIKMLIANAHEDFTRPLKQFYRYYLKFVDSHRRLEFIEEFVAGLTPYADDFHRQEENMYSRDWNKTPVYIFKGIDFRDLWRMSHLSLEHRAQYWTYIQTLYVIGSKLLRDNNKLQDLSREKEHLLAQIRANLKAKEEIARKLEDYLSDAKEQERNGNKPDFTQLYKIFGRDSLMVDILVELASEMDFSSMAEGAKSEGADANPLEFVQNMFKDQDALKELTRKTIQKIKTMLEKKGKTYEDLQRDMESFINKVRGIPMFSGLIDKVRGLCKDLPTAFESQSNEDIPPASTTEDPEINFKSELDYISGHLDGLMEKLRETVSSMDKMNFEI